MKRLYLTPEEQASLEAAHHSCEAIALKQFCCAQNTGQGYHRSLLVAEHALRLNIKLHFLPPYSPNLNPINIFKIL